MNVRCHPERNARKEFPTRFFAGRAGASRRNPSRPRKSRCGGLALQVWDCWRPGPSTPRSLVARDDTRENTALCIIIGGDSWPIIRLRLNRQPQYDAGHVPITEEFDSPKRSLPPAVPVAIALAIVAIVIGVIAFVERSKPVAQGGIDAVYASQPANMTNTMVASPGHGEQCRRQGALHQVH